MENSKELRCIKIATEARVAIAKNDLARLREDPPSFESPLAGFAWNFKWEKDVSGRRSQVLLMPVGVLAIGFLALMIPVSYCMNLFEIWQRKHKLKKKIKAHISLVDPQYPAQKTIESLWRVHGFAKYEASMEEQASLLERWIEILYGKDAVLGLNLCERLEGIIKNRIKGDLAYFDGESDVRCFFGPPAETLVCQLSDEFPNYDFVI